MYANVVINQNGSRIYSSFGKNLEKMIKEAEEIKIGVIAIEEAHAGKPPVWIRKEE